MFKEIDKDPSVCGHTQKHDLQRAEGFIFLWRKTEEVCLLMFLWNFTILSKMAQGINFLRHSFFLTVDVSWSSSEELQLCFRWRTFLITQICKAPKKEQYIALKTEVCKDLWQLYFWCLINLTSKENIISQSIIYDTLHSKLKPFLPVSLTDQCKTENFAIFKLVMCALSYTFYTYDLQTDDWNQELNQWPLQQATGFIKGADASTMRPTALPKKFFFFSF